MSLHPDPGTGVGEYPSTLGEPGLLRTKVRAPAAMERGIYPAGTQGVSTGLENIQTPMVIRHPCGLMSALEVLCGCLIQWQCTLPLSPRLMNQNCFSSAGRGNGRGIQ